MINWGKRVQVSGEAIAARLKERPRSPEAIEAGLKQFEIELYMAFVDHTAPNPELLTATALTVARRRLGLIH